MSDKRQRLEDPPAPVPEVIQITALRADIRARQVKLEGIIELAQWGLDHADKALAGSDWVFEEAKDA